MKLSVNDKSYPSKRHRDAIVFLDGKRVDRVVECDDVENYIIQVKLDGNGAYLEGDEVAKERIKGKVEIKY